MYHESICYTNYEKGFPICQESKADDLSKFRIIVIGTEYTPAIVARIVLFK